MVAPNLNFWPIVQDFGREAAAARLASRVDRRSADKCWPLIGKGTPDGYGRTGLNKRYVLLHRLAWTVEHWRDPGEMMVCHSCDNPRCCNPSHLFLGTAYDNHLDMATKGRRAPQSGEKRNRRRGTKLTVEQAEAIRRDRRERPVIAREYGISAGHVGSIRAGAAWGSVCRPRRHVPFGATPKILINHEGE